MSGDVAFSLAEGAFYGIRTGFIKGSGRFDNNAFSLNVPEAAIANGNAELSVKGKVSGGPFPLTIISKARDIDIGNLSGEALKMTGEPYALSGNCKSFIFEGTIDSQESVHGTAEVQAEKIAVIRHDKKNIVQGASLQWRHHVQGERPGIQRKCRCRKDFNEGFRDGKKISASGQISRGEDNPTAGNGNRPS